MDYAEALLKLSDATRAAANESAGPRREMLFAEADMLKGAANRFDQMTDAFQQIKAWSRAYPRDIFVPPTPEQRTRAHDALIAAGMSIDKFSADAMRHVAEGVAKIASSVTD